MEFKNLRVRHISGILRYKPSSLQWSAQNRPNHIVGVILDGVADHDFGYQRFTLSVNCVYFLNQKDDYEVHLRTESSTSFSIHFTTLDPISTDSFCVPVSNPDEIISILEKAGMAHSAENELLSLSYLYQLCHKLSQLHERAYFPRDTRILAAKEYIDLHYTDPGCIVEAIKNSKLSARRFGQLFRENFELTPNRYVNYRKVEYAKTLLSTNAISVTDAAAMCGFSDVYYFSRVFKSITGTSPGKWK